MSNKRFFFYLTFLVFLGALFFLWFYLQRYGRFMERGAVNPWEMIRHILPFCGLANLAVYILSLLHLQLLFLVLGKDLKDLQLQAARGGTLLFALLVETAFLVQIPQMGSDLLVGVAYTLPPLAVLVFLVVLLAVKVLGSSRFDPKRLK